MNYLKENFASKPYEIDSEETSKDSDESLSHAEAMEMATYKRDESAAMIADINCEYVMGQIRKWYSAFKISDAEFEFYYNNFYPNEISTFLFNNFYGGKFKDPYAVTNINRKDTIYLLICMKKILQRYKMPHLAHLCTAQVFGKYKENSIKTAKYLENVLNSTSYKEIVSKKFAYISELNMKDNPILRPLKTILNSVYKLVDYDDVINGYELNHINADAVSDEYILFLSYI